MIGRSGLALPGSKGNQRPARGRARGRGPGPARSRTSRARLRAEPSRRRVGRRAQRRAKGTRRARRGSWRAATTAWRRRARPPPRREEGRWRGKEHAYFGNGPGSREFREGSPGSPGCYRVRLAPPMNFRSIYQHGFARVAACTSHVAIADPPANAEAVLRQARACSDEGVAVALFPELCLTGYSIEDLLLQDAVLDGVEAARRDDRRGLRRAAAGARVRRPAAAPQPGLQLRGRRPPGAACSGSRRSRTCRRTASSTSAASSRPATTCAARSARRRRGAVRAGPALRRRGRPGPRRPRRGLRGHVDAGAAERRGRARGRDGAPQPLRQPDHDRPRRGPQAPVPLGLARAAWRPTSTPRPGRASRRPTCRGTARRWSTRTACCSPRATASPTATGGRSRTSTSTSCARSACGWGRSTTTGARTPRAPARSARSASPSTRPTSDLGLRRAVERFPFVPSDPDRLASTATRPTTSRSRASQQRLRAIGDPKVVIGVSGGLDSTHALIVAAQAMDRCGRPRSDILAFTLPGFATSGATKANAHRLMRALGVTAQELDIRPTAELMLGEIGHPYAARRAGLRRHVRERAGRAAHGLPVPDRQPARRDRPRHGRPVGARARLGDLRRRRPDEPLQRQRRRPEDAHPAPDPLGDLEPAVRRRGRRDARRDPRHGDQPGARARARSCSRRSRRSARTRCTTSRSSTCCATACGRRRSASSRGTPGATPRPEAGRPASPRPSAPPTTRPRSATGSSCS